MGLRCIVDREGIGLESQRATFRAEYFVTQAVERHGSDIRRGRADQLFETPAQFPRRFACERDRENAMRRRPSLVEDVRDAIGERARLAAASTREYEKRSFDVFDRCTLIRVQAIQINHK